MEDARPLTMSRSLDPAARDARSSSRQLTRVIGELSRTLHRAPTEEEIAQALALSRSQYCRTLGDISREGTPGLDVFRLDEGQLLRALDRVPAQLQSLLALYYQEECSAEEVGMVLGMTASRADELHTEALHRLQAEIALP